MSKRDWPAALDQRIEDVATAKDPYEASLYVGGIAVDHMAQSLVASRLYRIWAELQDGFELGLTDSAHTEEAMRRAAREWTAARDDEVAREAYLDRWDEDYRSGVDASAVRDLLSGLGPSGALPGHGRRWSKPYVTFRDVIDMVVGVASYLGRLLRLGVRTLRRGRRR